jgi:iron complex transport system permease protein
MMWLNRKNGLQPEKILLTGMALAALNDAAIRVWSASGDYRIQQLLVWLSGSTYHAEPLLSMWVAAAALLLFVLVRPLAPWLTLMGLGATTAQAAGLNVLWARRCLIILSAVMTAFSTLLIGPLSFIGLLAPHLAHAIGARSAAGQLSAAALIGASVMMAADWLGRIWLFPYEIPAGLMASLLGGLYFLWLMRKS